jgi:hypothetical protein
METAMHVQSGVASVVITGDLTPAVPVPATLTQPAAGSPNIWSWSAPIAVQPFRGAGDDGKRTITVIGADNAGNSTPLSVTVYLEAAIEPGLDPNDSLSALAYLIDLIGFTTGDFGRIATDSTNATKLAPADLARYFHQPFTLLKTDEQLHQVRLCIEVLRNYLAAPSDPVGYWNFNEGTGTTAADSSGNGLTGTLVSGATWAVGKAGDELQFALQFDGSSGYVQVGNPDQLKMTAAVSMAAWLYPTGPGTSPLGGVIVSKEAEYEMARFPDGSIQCAFANSVPGWNWINTGYVAPLNEWTHVVITYDGTQVSTYANGKQVGGPIPASGPIGSADPNDHDFRIGGRQLIAQFFQGLIDEVKIFNRALTAEEVAFLAVQNIPNAQLAADEAGYRLLAYQTLLLKLGTSFDELRMARAAGDSVRAALAARLGIGLEAARPDKLDALLLQQDNLTEAKLEQLFGLVDTTRNPLSPPASDPELLIWQLGYLRAAWIVEDYPADQDPRFPAPLVDPDLLVEGDFAPPPAGGGSNGAHDLWQARSGWLASQLQSLASDRQSGETDQARIGRLVGATLGTTMTDLLNLNTVYSQGNRIDDKLFAIPLGFAAFSYLVLLYNLAGVQPLLSDEWQAAYSILVQVQKQRQFITWRGQEAAANPGPILIVPDYFQLNSQIVGLPAWRATSQARETWRNSLASRIDMQNAIRQAMQAAVAATEEPCLPPLRDALVAAIAGVVTTPDPNDWLTERLLIDVGSSGAIETTRVSQAVETIQSILFSVRTRRFGLLGNVGNLASWQIDIPDTDFDADWQWMGTYGTWRAAMEVFLYPENVLSPNLRSQTTQQFYLDDPDHPGFVQSVRNNMPLTRQKARDCASGFLASVTNAAAALALGIPDWILKSLQDSQFAITDDVDSHTFTIGSNTMKGLSGWSALQSDQQHGLFKDYVDFSVTPPRLQAGKQLPSYLAEVFYFVPMYLALQLQQSGEYQVALDWFRLVYGYDQPLLPTDQRKVYFRLVLEETIATSYVRGFDWLRQLYPHEVIAPTRRNAYTRFTLLSMIRCFLDFADSEFARDTEESLPLARDLYLSGSELLKLPELEPQPEAEAFQPNPIVGALVDRATTSLFKLRNNLTIAGLRRQSSGAIGSGTALSVVAGGQIALPAPPAPEPTPYRYSALMDRAKQLVQLAQQVEGSYLAALQQTDAEQYNLLNAKKDLDLANANVDLQKLKVDEANDNITLATDQKAKAQTQFDTYDRWISVGPLDAETDMIQQYQAANDARNWVAGLQAAITATQASVSAAGGGILGTGIGAAWGPAIAVGGLAIGQAAAQTAANNAESQAQIDAANASFERRSQEWALQKSVAQNELTIGQDQINLANDQAAIASKEQDIALTQSAHAEAIVTFLTTKFTNAELYEWMSGILGGVYRYFLQQGTTIARLAEDQLSFERQQAGLGIAKGDYWQPPSQAAAAMPSAGNGGATADRRGLTGSARLLEDITRLDQYAFLTDTRKLQLSKSISLQQLAPFEFQQFRDTGVLPFATPMVLFDQDFPGHFLRLIKRARVSVVALIPPNQGIKASLATTGLSRTVIGGDVFRTVTIQRNPELIALTSPMNATGLFDLDTQPQLLLPFEGTGVDTSWEFRMPRAGNLFDFTTIADILLTLDYTALDSADYRQQVVRQLNRQVSRDRAFSFRQDFADQWYSLNNPDLSATPLNVQFSTGLTDFPPNIDQLTIQNVLIYFVYADNLALGIATASLTVVTQDAPPTSVGGQAQPIDGTISIRRGNADAWVQMVGRSPIGQWTLALPDTPDTSTGPGTRTLFQSGAIQDILFVITYGGLTPPWSY